MYFDFQVESLQADNDFTKEQLTNMKIKMEAIKEKDGDNQYIPEFESTGEYFQLQIKYHDHPYLTSIQHSNYSCLDVQM